MSEISSLRHLTELMLRCGGSQACDDLEELRIAAEVVGVIRTDVSTCMGMIASGTIEALVLPPCFGRVECYPELLHRGVTGKRPAVENVGTVAAGASVVMCSRPALALTPPWMSDAAATESLRRRKQY